MAKDLGDFVLDHWKMAFHQADGDGEGMVSILATALSFATVEAGLSLEEVLDRVRDDHATGLVARTQAAEAMKASKRQ